MKFSSKNLAAFYYQLGTLIQAGLPIQGALASLRKSGPRRMRGVVAELSAIVNEGTPLHDAMEKSGRRFEQLDKHAIGMSERSGALDVGLLSLSKYYETRATARNKLIAGSAYPAFMFVAAVFIVPVPDLVLGKIALASYLRNTVGSLALLVLVFWILSNLLRRLLATPRINVAVDQLLRAVPILGRLRFDYALSQWVSSIRLMLRAGIGIVPALEYASRTVHSPLIAAAYERAAPLIGGELEVSRALATTGAFPEDVIQFWATGEQSGRLDEMLDRLATFYEERWRRTLDQTVMWLPRIAYALVASFIIYQIFHVFSAYMGTYDELLK